MAVATSHSTGSGTTSAPGAETTTQQQTGYAPGARTDQDSGGLFGLINQLSAVTSLGPDIEAYIETIEKYHKTVIDKSLPEIKRVRLNEPVGAYAYVLGNVAMIILFQSKLLRDMAHFTPSSDQMVVAKNSLVRQLGAVPPNGNGPRLVSALIVTPADLVRANQMAQHIALTLSVANSPANQSNVGIMANTRFKVDPDVNMARTMINDQSPHAVQPRVDIGFVLYAATGRNYNQGFQGQSNDQENMRAIAAVGGYTEMIIGPNMGPRGELQFVPLVHITDITAIIPVAGIIPICLALAAEQFIGQLRWQAPFLSFMKGKVNLGNLANDPKDANKLWFANSRDDLDEWIRTTGSMTPSAYLALDVVDGRAKIPELAMYAYPENASLVYDSIQSFFGDRVRPDRSIAPFHIIGESFLGTYGDQTGMLVDSRNMDYLSLAAVAGRQNDQVRRILLSYPKDARERAQVISENTGGGFQSLYRAQIPVFSGQLLSALAGATKNTMDIQSPIQQNQMMPVDWFRQQAQPYADPFTVSHGPNRPGWGGQAYTGGNLFQF